MATKTFEVPTTIGMIEVDIIEVDYSDEIVLTSTQFLKEYLLIKGNINENHYIELRTKIGYSLVNVFEYEYSKEKLNDIVEFILIND